MSRLPPSQPSPLHSLFRFAFLTLVLAPAVLTPALHAQSTWTAVPAPTAQNLWSVAHRPASATTSLFVAVGESGTILTSPDGLAWTARVSGTTRWLTSVAYVTGQFIAVGEAATVLVSPDGITWTPRTVTTNPNAPRLNALTYGNGTYLAVAEDGSSYTSPDTLTWRSEANRLPRARGLVFAYGHFVVTGEAGSVSTSLNASSFTSRGTALPSFLESVTYARRTFVAVGAGGLILTSPTAERWTAPPLAATSATLRGVTFFNHHFVAVGESGTILTSPDGLTWTPRALPSAATPLFTAIAASETVALTVGHAGAIYRSTVSPAAVAIVTPPQDLTEAVGSHVLLSVVATGPGPLTYEWSFNGQPLAAPNSHSDTLLLQNIQLAHAGRYTVTITSSLGTPTPPIPATASATLTVVPAFAVPNSFLDLAFTVSPDLTSAPTTALEQPDGKILLGGNFLFLVNGTGQTGLARLNLDGTLDPAFHAGTGASGGAALVSALALQPDGRILAGGAFTAMSGTARPNLARLTATGALDLTFAPPASLATSPVTQIVVQADGKLLVLDQSGRLVRLHTDGSLDSGFMPPDSSFPVLRTAVTADGKILVGGGQLSSNSLVKRLLADGTPDPTFTTAVFGVPGLQLLHVLPDGRFLAGASFAVTAGSWGLARFHADGTRDATYPAQSGFLNRNSARFTADSAGRVTITIGSSPFISFLGSFVRLRSDGSIDPTLRLTNPAANFGFPSIVPLANGQLLLLGAFISIDGTPRLRLARTVAANAPAPNLPVLAAASPQIVTARAGDPVTLTVSAAGTAPFTTTWNSANSPPGTASADGASYTIPNPQSNGLYFATISNPAGSLASPAFLVLVEPAAPSIVRAPVTLSVNSGRTAVFTVDARGSDPRTYQWFFNNSPISPNTPTLTIPNVTAAHAGTYTLVIRNALGTVTTTPARLTVDDTSRLANLATRGSVGLGENVLTTGFVLRGPVPRTLLIRGIGPGLTPFGVTGTIPNPSLTLFDSTGTKLAENDDWNAANSGATAALFQAYGAFPLPNGSADAALVRTLAPGAYTVQLSGSGNTTGLALAEIYEADTLPTRLVNLSSRLLVGEGASVAIPGVVIAGTVPRQLLIRAIGPALAPFGVTGFLADPTLTLTTADGTVIATNDNWSTNPNAAALAATTATVGAFALSPNSRDAALLVTVPPGNYTAQISASATSTSTPGLPANAAAASGLALVEIYEVP